MGPGTFTGGRIVYPLSMSRGGWLEMEFSLMHMAQGAIRRLAFAGWLGLIGLTGLPAHTACAAAPPERALPDNTILFIKINDVKTFGDSFRNSQYGQLWRDPALKEFREELSQRLEEGAKSIKQRIGLSVKELLEIPQGSLAIAGIGRDDPNLPVALMVIADAGENQKKLADVLMRAAKAGAKVSTESFSGLTLHLVVPPKADGDKDDKEKDPAKKTPPRPPLVWTNAGSLFFIGSDLEVIKDVAAHREGRDSSLATSETFNKTQAKIDPKSAQAIWYLDIAKVVKLAINANAAGQQAQAQQMDVMANELGAYGLKSVGGSFTLGAGKYDSFTKTFFNAPGPLTGLLKIFSLPPIALRPEAWVPATVASYQTVSFDLDNAYEAINDLVNKFQPGMINLLEQQLVGPNGGQPLSFKNDVFGPLGDRITLIGDFKKPITVDSQRMLGAIALEDPKAFQNTFTSILQIAGAAPEKRQFQGTTIYDFAVNLPNAPQGNGAPALKGPISVAIAKDTLFLTTDTTLLEQILRPGSPSLVDSTSYQSIAKEFPEKMSGMSYWRPDESAKLTYDMVKNGTFAKAVDQGMATRPGGRDMPSLSKLIPVEKLPDFSVLSKYLSLGGSSSLMDEDGLTMTGFTIRKSSP
jgi:hypothetical protein